MTFALPPWLRHDVGIVEGLLAGTIVNTVVFGQSLSHASPSVGILPGGAAGAICGLVRARRHDWTEGQATLIRTGSILGAALPCAAYFAAFGRTDDKAQTVMASFAIPAGIAGAWVTERWVRNARLTAHEGVLATGTTIGGALAGAGVGYLAAGGVGGDEHDFSHPAWRWAAAGGAVGGATGFWAGLSLVRRQPAGSGRAEARSRIEVNWASLAAGFLDADPSFSVPRMIVLSF